MKNSNAKTVRLNNLVQLELGTNRFMTTLFDGKDGVYFDEYGGELFVVKCIGHGVVNGQSAKIYEIDFGDEVKRGPMLDHGFNEYLGAK